MFGARTLREEVKGDGIRIRGKLSWTGSHSFTRMWLAERDRVNCDMKKVTLSSYNAASLSYRLSCIRSLHIYIRY